MGRRNIKIDREDERQEQYDAIAVCPKCGERDQADMDYCKICGRKLKIDRGAEPLDAVDELQHSMGRRMGRWIELSHSADFPTDDDKTEDTQEE